MTRQRNRIADRRLDGTAAAVIVLALLAVLVVLSARLWPERLAVLLGVNDLQGVGLSTESSGSDLPTTGVRLVALLIGAVLSTVMTGVLAVDASRSPDSRWPTGIDRVGAPVAIGFVHLAAGSVPVLYLVSFAGIVYYLSHRGLPVSKHGGPVSDPSGDA